MPSFSKVRLDHFAAIRPQEENCSVCVGVSMEKSGAAMCQVCWEYPP